MMSYKRILIKLSGESLGGTTGHGIENEAMTRICKEIKTCADQGYEIGIVVGGGNFWRGRSNQNMEMSVSHTIGMLGIIMNSLALGEMFKELGSQTEVMSTIEMNKVVPLYNYERAMQAFKDKKIVIFGGGVGVPYFSTDTAAALKAIETHADVMIKATNVDGVYTADPKTDPTATKIPELKLSELLAKQLKVLDLTATSLCVENNMPIMVININQEGNLLKALGGENVGTIVK